MALKILPAVAFGTCAVLFISSLICLLVQPSLELIAPLWAALLTIAAAALAASIISRRPARGGKGQETGLYIYLDLILLAALALAIVAGFLSPDLVIKRPLGVGASFRYEIVLPALTAAAGVLGIKDSVNLIYGQGAKGREALVFLAIRFSAVLALLLLGGILFIIIYKGMGAISWEFLTTPHRSLGQKGGISTVIAGTFWMVLGAIVVSAPLGLGAAIYMHEYSKNPRLKRTITIAVSCLNGVPSVVFGLFGLAFLVSTFGVSLLAGSIVLGLINIPTILLTCQEALKSVPNSLREGSLALGATKWQTISRVVLPSAMPGILTGLIMGVAKASGETAPIMWTAVTFTATPVQMVYGIIPNVFQPVNNLDYHLLNLIYFLGAWDVEANAWGTALVLISLVLGTNMLAILVRNHYRRKISW
ncbi:MAG: phosphate ABC transporter permease PstA [Methanotrichaceae archaeon]|nr:phosphate ABC transporter permease PstA [Methanotrichaceae archaeon]